MNAGVVKDVVGGVLTENAIERVADGRLEGDMEAPSVTTVIVARGVVDGRPEGDMEAPSVTTLRVARGEKEGVGTRVALGDTIHSGSKSSHWAPM